jgi:soluble lytic murein transglycosylase-like protein
MRSFYRPLVILIALAAAHAAYAGDQQYEPLSAAVQTSMSHTISDRAQIRLVFSDPQDATRWLLAMSNKLAKRIPDTEYRFDVLKTIHYEATRAGLDPQLVLSIIQVESGFKKYAVSRAGARGLMQVMPFWQKLIGNDKQNLFDLRTNLRFGCTILRHYLDIEQGNLFRALGRYNGSLGRAEYPNLVMGAWRNVFRYTGPVA